MAAARRSPLAAAERRVRAERPCVRRLERGTIEAPGHRSNEASA
jgi:hypothetical protein